MIVEILNLKSVKPFMHYDFLIDRTSPVGNVYPMHVETMSELVCDQYEEYFKRMIDIAPSNFNDYLEQMVTACKTYGELRLFCWCAPKRCHGETIRNYLVWRYHSDQ